MVLLSSLYSVTDYLCVRLFTYASADSSEIQI